MTTEGRKLIKFRCPVDKREFETYTRDDARVVFRCADCVMADNGNCCGPVPVTPQMESPITEAIKKLERGRPGRPKKTKPVDTKIQGFLSAIEPEHKKAQPANPADVGQETAHEVEVKPQNETEPIKEPVTVLSEPVDDSEAACKMALLGLRAYNGLRLQRKADDIALKFQNEIRIARAEGIGWKPIAATLSKHGFKIGWHGIQKAFNRLNERQEKVGA